MDKKFELEEKLTQCCDILDSCLDSIKTYDVEPVVENQRSIVTAISEITTVLFQFEKFRKKAEEPWKLKCSFCKLNEDQVAQLIQGPGVLICNSCVELCIENLKSSKDYTARETDLGLSVPRHTTIGHIRKITSNHHFDTKLTLRLTDESA